MSLGFWFNCLFPNDDYDYYGYYDTFIETLNPKKYLKIKLAEARPGRLTQMLEASQEASALERGGSCGF